jgi:hypothetical protein
MSCALVHGDDENRLDPGSKTTLDISQATRQLDAVTPESSPSQIAAAIQTRLDFLHSHRLPGRVVLPLGHWRIDRPIFMNGDNKELVGAGKDQTILEAADGFHGMPLLNAGARTSFDERPLQTCNRVWLTDPNQRVLDESVRGERYGLRTYAEFPAGKSPSTSHLALTARNAKNWTLGTAYKTNDVALVPAPASARPVEAVCLQDHTASAGDQPFRGKDWKSRWVTKIPFHVQFFADPLTAGAYDPATHRASNWIGMDQFTLDFAFTLNAEPKVFDGPRMLCGEVMSDTSRPTGYVWMLMSHPDGQLTFQMVLADGTTSSIILAKNCHTAGTYRLALQLDFRSRTVQAWIRRPGEADLQRTCNDTTAIPVNGKFQELEYGFFMITGGDSGNVAGSNGTLSPPIDITVCGLHMSAALRYDSAVNLVDLATRKPVDDNFRYFTNDGGTLAFLPLTDHPDEIALPTTGLLVTVQHGPAASDAGQKGYGYFKVPAQVYGIGRPRISDLTLRVGPTWGVGIVNWHTLDAQLTELDIRGGFYAIGDLFYGAQYTFNVRNCRLSGSEAAFNGSSNIVYMKDVTIDPVGRYGILVSGSNMTLDGVRFGDPQIHRSQYYFRHLSSVLYGGMNLLSDVQADAPAGSQYPSRAAFSQQNIWIFRTSVVLRDCSVSNLGSEATFLDLPYGVGPCSARLLMENCRYHGNPIASWVRSDSPWWSGQFVGYDRQAPVRKLLEYRPAPGPEWKPGTKYGAHSLVTYRHEGWLSTQEHLADKANSPGAELGRQFWEPAIPRIFFQPANPN